MPYIPRGFSFALFCQVLLHDCAAVMLDLASRQATNTIVRYDWARRRKPTRFFWLKNHTGETASEFLRIDALPAPNLEERSRLDLKCGLPHPGASGEVLYTYDGHGRKRCFVVVTPKATPGAPSANGTMGVLMLFHGAGQNAQRCGRTWNYKENLDDAAQRHKFVLVCGEAVQNEHGHGGSWLFPEIVNSSTPCSNSDSQDLVYVKNVLNYLSGNVPEVDASRVFMMGVSMGSWMAAYASSCFKREHPLRISAMGMHSSGLKKRHDGLHMPRDVYNPRYRWGECPQCKYMPIFPRRWTDPLGLKACVFDTDHDFPDFRKSSQQMVDTWRKLNNSAEFHMGRGVHAVVKEWESMLKCLDDGTGRLLQNSSARVMFSGSTATSKRFWSTTRFERAPRTSFRFRRS